MRPKPEPKFSVGDGVRVVQVVTEYENRTGVVVEVWDDANRIEYLVEFVDFNRLPYEEWELEMA
jgi:hypothetical protein